MKVFLSYANADREWAKQLADRLHDAGLEVWNRHDELGAGDNWAAKIGEALEQSDFLVVLLSPDAVESSWVQREIEYALGSKRYDNRLLPVVVRRTDRVPWDPQEAKAAAPRG